MLDVHFVSCSSWSEGRALEIALQLECHTTEFGKWMFENLHFMLTPLTHAALLLELCGPSLLLLPPTLPFLLAKCGSWVS